MVTMSAARPCTHARVAIAEQLCPLLEPVLLFYFMTPGTKPFFLARTTKNSKGSNFTINFNYLRNGLEIVTTEKKWT